MKVHPLHLPAGSTWLPRPSAISLASLMHQQPRQPDFHRQRECRLGAVAGGCREEWGEGFNMAHRAESQVRESVRRYCGRFGDDLRAGSDRRHGNSALRVGENTGNKNIVCCSENSGDLFVIFDAG